MVAVLGFFGAQCFGILCIDLWGQLLQVSSSSGGIKKIAGLRVDSDRGEGLDIYEHGESCYN